MSRVSRSKWERIILQSDNAYFFHSPLWAKILEKTYTYRKATSLYHINDREILVPMMERKAYGFKFLDSMPLGYGGVFPESEITSEDFKLLLDHIIGGRHLILNLNLPPLLNMSSSVKSAIKVKNKWDYTHLLCLDGKNFEYIWKNNYKKKTRNSIRKAMKSKIEIKEGNSLDDFKDYYNLYEKASKKWGYENPPHSFDLYKNLHKYGSPHVKLSFAIKDDIKIAGLIIFRYSGTVFYWGSAFLDDYGTLYPTGLLLNDSIEQASQDGYKYFNFGASGELKSVRKFKEGFGAEKVEINRYKALSNIGKIASFFKRG